ncbi:hypothetical protein [Aminobacter ciceronei]|uniref:Uncharacterized protein n=1 Tax=Aminobacter ciceronei TaxID=150723 RepID=A0ABR6C6Y2_9HYPH|nr:hypothetical protein [Aminobacter ciceronei]MBA8906476.1 hypothetical protein [Aminobacter ciceronei]MBA9020398.1 hypothetical protein [Aminobacter ciceronei]
MLTLDQIETLLGVEPRKRVERKRRGGDSADKGAAYEREYALSRIIQLAVECLMSENDGTNIYLQAQALCFIDDFLVHFPDRTIFSQLKDKQKQGWDGLDEDCRHQRSCNDEADIVGCIEIVVSRADVVTKLRESCPEDLSDVALLHFETPFAGYDEAVSVMLEPYNTQNAKRDSRAHILAAWEDLGRNASLSEILWSASRLSSWTLRTLEPQFQLSEDVRNILDQIADFGYGLRARTLLYHFSNGRGHVPYECGTERWTNFENRLKLAPPSDFLEFYALLKDTQ